MRTNSTTIVKLSSVVILVLAGCSKPNQEPATKAAEISEVRTLSLAKELFAEKISWSDSKNSRAIIWNDVIGPSDAITEIESERYLHKPREYEWMLAIDTVPGAYFRHPVNYAYLTFLNPLVSMIGRENLPALNYEKLWPDLSAFVDNPEVVYSNCWLDRPVVRTANGVDKPEFVDWPPRMSSDTCSNEKRAYAVIIHNLPELQSSSETVENIDLMVKGLKASGYEVLEFLPAPGLIEKVPYVNLSTREGGGIFQLKNFINKHRDLNDCCEEIVVYITGETGVLENHGSNYTYFDLPFAYRGESGKRDAAKRFFAEDLALMFSDLKTCHVNVIVDANNAAGFAEDLLSIPQVESVVTSCSIGEYTISSAVETLDAGKFTDPFGLDDGEVGSEFTSSFVKGVMDHLATRTADDVPEKAHVLAKKGFDSVLELDLGYLGGQTNPSAKARTMSSDCPCGVDTYKSF